MWHLTIQELILAVLWLFQHTSVKYNARNSLDANFLPMIWHQKFVHSRMQSQIRIEKIMPFQDLANAMRVNNFQLFING